MENFSFETRKEKGLLLFLLLFMILPEVIASTIKEEKKISQKEWINVSIYWNLIIYTENPVNSRSILNLVKN